MKVLWIGGKTHLALFALREIYAGDEITYDYGDKKAHWRKVGLRKIYYCFVKNSLSVQPAITKELYSLLRVFGS